MILCSASSGFWPSSKKTLGEEGKIGRFGDKQDLEERVSKLDDVDFLGKQELASVATMISLTDKQFQEWLELQRELRKLLRGLLTSTTGAARQSSRARKQ